MLEVAFYFVMELLLLLLMAAGATAAVIFLVGASAALINRLLPDTRAAAWFRSQFSYGKVTVSETPDDGKTRVYISGPMSGYVDYNYPAFNAEAAALRALGFYVENPAENQVPACGSWQGYMRNAIAQMMRCDVVVMLPGWEQSQGATLERSIAKQLNIPVTERTTRHLDFDNPEFTQDWLDVREFARSSGRVQA